MARSTGAKVNYRKEFHMRFMVIVKASKSSEAGVLPSRELLEAMGKFNEEMIKAGVMPSTELFEAMGKFNEEMIKAGIMLAGEGLQPSSKGARIRFTPDGKRTVIDGPFAETKELVAGFWLIQVKSKAEAIEWMRRCPAPTEGEACEIEIRQVFEAEDFAPVATPEEIEREHRMREQAAAAAAKR